MDCRISFVILYLSLFLWVSVLFLIILTFTIFFAFLHVLEGFASPDQAKTEKGMKMHVSIAMWTKQNACTCQSASPRWNRLSIELFFIASDVGGHYFIS